MLPRQLCVLVYFLCRNVQLCLVHEVLIGCCRHALEYNEEVLFLTHEEIMAKLRYFNLVAMPKVVHGVVSSLGQFVQMAISFMVCS